MQGKVLAVGMFYFSTIDPMKQIWLLILFCVGTTAAAQVACVPMWPGTDSGIYPDTIVNLPPATVGQPYATEIHFKIPTSADFNGTTVQVVKVVLTGVDGFQNIPSSVPFSFSCQPSDCSFAADSLGCVAITGTPTTVGVYPLTILTNVYITPVLYVPLSVGGYKIVVQEESAIDQNLALTPDVLLAPNPADDQVVVRMWGIPAGRAELMFFGPYGQCLFAQQLEVGPGFHEIKVDVSTWMTGMYLCRFRKQDIDVNRIIAKVD